MLDIRLLLNPELNEEVTVRPDGHISTTAAQDAVAYGRTPAELADTLRGLYAKELENPRVTVEVKSFAPTRIYVAGEVNTPGEFITVGPTLTLSQAIARAGGTKLSSDDTAVFVIRRGPNDKPAFFSTKWKALRQGRDPDADIRLAPYDVVYVPKLGVAEVYQFYNQYIGQFANPSFGFSYLLNPEATAARSSPSPPRTDWDAAPGRSAPRPCRYACHAGARSVQDCCFDRSRRAALLQSAATSTSGQAPSWSSGTTLGIHNFADAS